MRKTGTIIDRTLGITAILAGILVIGSMLIPCGQVVSRYFVGRPLGWVIEINEYILLYVTFLVAPWILKAEGHVKIEIVVGRLGPRTRLGLNIFTSIIAAIVCFILAFYGTKVTWGQLLSGYYAPTILEPPKFIFTAIIPFGSFLLFIQFLRRAYVNLVSLRESQGKRQC